MSQHASPLRADQWDVLAALLDRLLPADELGPGARDLGAVTYVERALAGPSSDDVDAYRAGLDALDERARRQLGTGFAALPGDDQDAVLQAFDTEGSPDRAFIDLACEHLYESVLGDPAHGGNANFDGWRLVGFGGPRRAQSEADQGLDAVPAGPPRSTYDDPFFADGGAR
jgi:hypothetical protein